MAVTNVADPVDFETYGDYRPPAPSPSPVPTFTPARASPPTAWSPSEVEPAAFRRPSYRFQSRITADGSSGYRAEPGRYHLNISGACGHTGPHDPRVSR